MGGGQDGVELVTVKEFEVLIAHYDLPNWGFRPTRPYFGRVLH
jgi:hypothetical protein